MAKKQTKQTKKRKVRIDAVGEAHIGSSFNNIIISLTNNQGQVISWSSAGKMGFRGSKKNCSDGSRRLWSCGIGGRT
jgi:small subunit ribosomal protein S11